MEWGGSGLVAIRAPPRAPCWLVCAALPTRVCAVACWQAPGSPSDGGKHSHNGVHFACVSQEPWAHVLRGDFGVRNMIDNLRSHGRNMHRMQRNATGGFLGRRVSVEAKDKDKDKDKDALAATSGRASIPLPVLHPDGRIRSVWNLAMTLLIVYCGIVVPLEIAFDSAMAASMGATGWQVWESWNLVVDGIFIVDIILNFRSVHCGTARSPLSSVRSGLWMLHMPPAGAGSHACAATPPLS